VSRETHFTISLPVAPDAIARARRAVEELAPDVDEPTLLHVRLLVSELVTNAVRHAPPERREEIELTVERREDAVRIDVLDHGPGFVPVPRPDSGPRASGWGLNIVARLATRWGVENDQGARVWFEIETSGDRGRDRDGAAA